MRNPNGYGSIFKLSGKRRRPYCVRIACKYTFDGEKAVEHRPVLGYYRTKAEALQALAEYNRSPYDISDKPTFAEIYEKWYAEKAKTIGTKHQSAYKNAFEKCSEIHDKPVSDLRLQDYQAIISRYNGYSKTALTVLKAVMSGVSKYAMRYDYITKDYTTFLHGEYADEKDIHKPYTDSEIDALWAQPPSLIRDLTLALLYSGFRISELLALRSDSIDLDGMTFTGGSKTKAGKNRVVPIHSRIQPIMQMYPDGFHISYKQSYTLMKAAGHIPHDTRHTFISRLQSASADHICIERLVGHASKGVTDAVYTHKDIEELRRTIELLK